MVEHEIPDTPENRERAKRIWPELTITDTDDEFDFVGWPKRGREVIVGKIDNYGRIDCPKCQTHVVFDKPPEIDGNKRTYYAVCGGCLHNIRVVATMPDEPSSQDS